MDDAKKWWHVWVVGGAAMEAHEVSARAAADFYMRNQSIRTAYLTEEVIMVVEVDAVQKFALKVEVLEA